MIEYCYFDADPLMLLYCSIHVLFGFSLWTGPVGAFLISLTLSILLVSLKAAIEYLIYRVRVYRNHQRQK